MPFSTVTEDFEVGIKVLGFLTILLAGQE